mmetsp:Transcript_16218/g.63242  ORF Transcript_16218/g.63242 Transcript_16218/m.63242 type:complete len:106 (+) Transcript_16218:77-394(+)
MGSFEEFYASLAMREDVDTEHDQCMICDDGPADGLLGSRLCLVSPYPCEGHQCRCTERLACIRCLVKFLWEKTNSVLKQQGRYRAACPFCKAEYCHMDLVHVVQA